MGGRCERMQQRQGASTPTCHKAPLARVSTSASLHVRPHRVQWPLARPLIIKRVLPNDRQYLVGSIDMPKPPRGQESPVEETTRTYVAQPGRLFGAEEELAGSVIMHLNRLLTLWDMDPSVQLHILACVEATRRSPCRRNGDRRAPLSRVRL